MGWINGPHPSVEDGVVERQLCFSSGDKCCIKETIVKIRNCKGYFVYQFPRKVPICPSKYCTVYKLEWADSRVGVSNRNIIPDDKFTASSQKDGTIYKTHYARLHGRDGAWEPRTNDDPNEYLQIDLGAVFVIRAVATQGSPDWTGWTSEYKIATSVDSDSCTLYQSRGQVKLFSGNKDRNSVVKNTLDGTRTLCRFIRFIPTQYKIWKVLRVEVYGNRLNESLHSNNTQNEWQGWLKGRDKKVQWKILDEISYEKATSSIKVSRRPQGENFTQDYESDIGFSLVHQNHSVSAKIRQTLEEMTICLWTSINSSSPTIISVSYVNEEKEKTAIAFVKIEDTARNGTRKWIHICVTWMSNFGVWQTYIDGAAIDNGLGMLDTQELKRGNRISITFDSQDHQTEVKYSRLNIWKDVLSKQDILYMSYICGSETGDLLGWKDYLKLLPRASSGFGIYNSTCRGKQGNVMSLIGASSPEAPTSLARIESPRFQRSSESPGRCLKFKYKMWGPGAKVIIIYQEFDNKEYSKRPIWMVKDSDDNRWRDGQVTLTAVTAYKLAIEGEVTNRPGLMSIGALHTTEGYCTDIIPPSARQACNEILSNTAGYIVSPYYPGYYENNARCTWTIEASKGHLIRLEFKTFELESSQRCSADFVEVYDGEAALSSSRIGRYCGSRYQEIIQSQSDTIKITFSSNNDVTRSGFKAYYQIIKDAEDDGCVQDCPLSCTCRKAANTSGIIVTSRQLRSIPYRLPKNTRAILFSGSKIHQVKSNAFHRLSHLSLIDLSLNRIFVVEEMSFVNLPSLKILRMNGNFIKEVWRNMFSGLEQLESMDLGENFISNIKWDAFSGFPGLRALSLRSNQINKLHKLTFQNTTNLTYLYLQNNALKSIPAGLFRQQKYLEILLLHQNDMQRIDKSTFEGLINLRKLSLKNNSINEQTLSNDVFKNLQKLEYLSTDSFIMCCYATKSIPNLNCVSPGNEFSSCDDMLKSIYVQICIWVEGVLATFGNLAVVSWWIFLSTRRRRTKRKINSVQSLLFCHLAFADLLMGIYLLMIATYNELWKGEYFLHDVEWRAGIKCEIAGAIATLSSEVSVMVLVAIAADRINTIVFQLSSRRTNLKMAHVLCLFIWVIGFVISFTPLLAPSYFNDKISGFRFYGRSTVCLPLQLSNDRPAGWEYSVAVFIAFNGAAFFFILVGYIAIFIKVRKSARNVRSSSSSESAVGKRVLFVILTDFFCWMPVVVLGLLSLVHDFNDPSVYVWVAVFVLPVNSAINPVLYTFSSAQTVNTMKSIRRRWRNEQTPQTRPAQAMPLKEFRSPEREDPEQIVSQGLDTRL